jgi:Ring finger domain
LSSEITNVRENLKHCSETGDTDAIDAELGCCNNMSDCETVDSGEACWIKVDVSAEPRYVEGNCSICLLQFEDGDVFVSSTRKACSHGFHQDCALSWLASGKKRCPLCRNFFVPGSRVDDKDIIAHREGDTKAYIPNAILMDATKEGSEDSITIFSNTGTIEDENNAEDVLYDSHITIYSKRHSESRINVASSTTNASVRDCDELPVRIDDSNVKVIDEVSKHSDASDRVIIKESRNNSWLNREKSVRGKANFQIHPLSM